MAIPLPEEIRDVIDSPAFAHVATLGPDGYPQNTVMWIDRDGDRLLLNTVEGRAKWRNLQRDPRLSISISPPDDPYANYSLKGRVVEMRTSDGKAVIDRLAAKYLDADEYPWGKRGEVRVTMVVAVEGIAHNQ